MVGMLWFDVQCLSWTKRSIKRDEIDVFIHKRAGCQLNAYIGTFVTALEACLS